MVKTVTLNADIPASRELRITLPPDVPTGSAAIVIMVSPSGSGTSATFGDLLNSEFLGMWRDRADIKDSLEFARKLRSEGWNRPAR
jgi:Tfp pilus assembly ATPase PilU